MKARRRLHAWLLGVSLVCSGVSWAIWHDASRPNLELLPSMVRTPAAKGFTPNAAFPDGKTLQPPVPGTIRRGAAPLHFGVGAEEAERAGEELQAPVPGDPKAALERGRVVYSTFCLPCHGAGGWGDGLVVQSGFVSPPPLLGPRALSMKEGQLFHIVTHGQGDMSPHAAQIEREDRWQAVLWIREMRRRVARTRTGEGGV